MALDFCLPDLKPLVWASTVSTDDHAVDNLISPNTSCRQRGFLAERFIKPPVRIVLQFPCNVDLCAISLLARVGSQRSCGFEILTQTKLVEDPLFELDIGQKRTTNDEGIFLPVGRQFDKTADEFVFVNRRYQPRSQISGLDLPDLSVTSQRAVKDMRHHNQNSISSVSHVMIKINQTHGACVPGIKNLHIWGQPSVKCGRKVMDTIVKISRDVFNKRSDVIHTTETPLVDLFSNIQEKVVDKNSKYFIGDIEIPTDFIDPITLEVMSLPVLLPSGHTVDQSTLDRHSDTEATWNRVPSDPFTGVAFHPGSRPAFSNTLKSRIDEFLLKSQIDVTHVARTVGGAQAVTRTHVPKHPVYVPPLTSQSAEQTCPLKRKSQDAVTLRDHSPKKAKKLDHESILSKSLDESLQTALSGLPKFFGNSKQPCRTQQSGNSKQPCRTQQSIRETVVCFECSATVPGYGLPCGHRLCRSCLIKLGNNVQCRVCLKNYTQNSATKIHAHEGKLYTHH